MYKKLFLLLVFVAAGLYLGYLFVTPGWEEAYPPKIEEAETTPVILYFMTVEDGQEELAPIEREITVDNGKEKSALQSLLTGPTSEEKEEGITTSIPTETQLLSFELVEGTATADFTEQLDPGGGSAWVTAIRNQITHTLEQFETVERTVIKIESSTEEDILQP